MATLEKIRSKSVFLIVVIGVALLAFIVGDAITNGRNLFGKGSRIAKAADKKIDISEYQQREKELSDLYHDQGIDQSEISTMALQQLIDEAFIDQAAKKMEFAIDDKDLAFYIYEAPVLPVQMFMARNFPGNFSVRQAYDAINNPNKYGIAPATAENLKQAWAAMEEDVAQSVKRQMYENLVVGSIKANNLDRKDMHERATQSRNVNIAMKPITPDMLEGYQVSDAEINQLYNENKQMFRVNDPTTTIGFIYTEVAPSAADLTNAQNLSAESAKALAAGQPLSQALQKQGVRADKQSLTAQYASNPRISRFPYNGGMLASAPVDSVMSYTNGNYYINIKKTGSKTVNDRMLLYGFSVPTAQIALLDSVLRTGAAPEDVAKLTNNQGSYIPNAFGNDNDIYFYAQNPNYRRAVSSDVAQKLDNAQVGDVIVVMTGDEKAPSFLARVESAEPAEVYDFEAYNYELYPSSNTVTDAKDKLEAFGGKYKNADAFSKNAVASGYNYLPVTIDAYTSHINSPRNLAYQFPYFPNSSAVVQWAMGDVTSGEVSDVMDNGDSRNPWLYLAVVANQADEFLPANDPKVKEVLTNMIKRRKAGDDLVKQYSGKGTLDATAEAMGVTVMPMGDTRFATFAQGGDIPVSARIAGTAPGTKVYVVKGDNAVYAYEVIGENDNQTPAVDSKNNSSYLLTHYNVRTPNRYTTLGKMLRGNKKVENNRYEMMGRK